MAKILFAPSINRHVASPPVSVAAATIREALSMAFDSNPTVRGYVVDEQNKLRHHMVVFLDGQPIRDREGMTDAVTAQSEIYVFQALSGG